MASTPSPAGADQPDINYGPKILALTATPTVLALVVVCTRVWVRAVITKCVGWDDWTMMTAMLTSLVGMSIVIPEVHYGAGRHAAYLEAADQSFGLLLNFITQPVYLASISLVKVSIGLFLLRLSPVPFFRRFIMIMEAFVAIYTIIGLCTLLSQCRPLRVLWDPTVTDAVCFSNETLRGLAYSNAACGILADLIFALLPIPMLWNVKLRKRIKYSVLGILALGLFATAACIVKVYFVTSYGKYYDFLWDSTNLTIWTVMELNVAIIAASIPCLRPLFSWFNRTTTSQRSYSMNRVKPYSRHLDGQASGSHGASKTVSRDPNLGLYTTAIATRSSGSGEWGNNSKEKINAPQVGEATSLDGGEIIKTTNVTVSCDKVSLNKKRSIEDRV